MALAPQQRASDHVNHVSMSSLQSKRESSATKLLIHQQPNDLRMEWVAENLEFVLGVALLLGTMFAWRWRHLL